jgi:dihydroorotase
LIDLHGHVYDRGIRISVDPDHVGIARGVTTIVDGGSTGATTFEGFRKYVIERATTDVYALLNIATIGLVVTNELFLDPEIVDPQAAVRVIEQHRDRILGIKVRVRGHRESLAADLQALRKAREAADATRLPIMMHWSNEPELLELLRPGDIVTHPFNPPRVGPSLLDGKGRVLPQILELRQRGILTDFAHGNHLKWDIAEQAAVEGWFPDTISTDIHRAHLAPSGAVIDLPTTMAKFLYLGLSLEQVIDRVTARPATALNFPERIGILKPGERADVSVFEVVRENVELRDTTGATRVGSQKIVPVTTVKSGHLVRI